MELHLMIIKIEMDFTDLNEKTRCPYNENHIFDKEKLIFHLNRCKDKLKVGHLFTSCKYNSIHIIRKEDVETHEIICQDRADIRDLTQQLRDTIRAIDDERERSREKVKREQEGQEEQALKKEVKLENPDEVDFDSCPLCKKIMHELTSMRKVVGEGTKEKICKAEKMIRLHHELQKRMEKMEKKL